MTTKDLLSMSAAQLVMLCQDKQIEIERLQREVALRKEFMDQCRSIPHFVATLDVIERAICGK